MGYWVGELVRLRAVEPDDAAFFYELNLEAEIERNLEMVYPPSSMAHQRAFTERVSQPDFPANHALQLIIESRETGEAVGSISTHNCDPRSGTFEYGLAIREAHRGHGYATGAIQLILRYYFLELRYQKANPSVFAFNAHSVRLHEKLGFQLEGRRRRSVYSNGEYYDVLLFGMTAEEFLELRNW